MEERLDELSASKEIKSLQTPRTTSEYGLSFSSNIANTPGTTHSNPNSSPKEIPISTEDEQSTKSQASFPPIPSAPALKPQRHSSLVSKSSWRLSFTSENRGAYLRSLSQDRSSTHIRDISTLQRTSQLYHNHGLRSTSQALTWSDGSSTGVPSTSAKYDDKNDTPSDVRLKDMVLSQHLEACLQNPVRLQQLSTGEGESNCQCLPSASYVVIPPRITKGYPSIESDFHPTIDNNSWPNAPGAELRERDGSVVVSHTPLHVDTVNALGMLTLNDVREGNTLTHSQHSGFKAPPESMLVASLSTGGYDGSIEGMRLTLRTSPVAILPYVEHCDKITSCIHHLIDDEVTAAWRKVVHQKTSSEDTNVSAKMMIPQSGNILDGWAGKKRSQIYGNLSTNHSVQPVMKAGEKLVEDNPNISNNTMLEKEGYFKDWERGLHRAKQKAKTTFYRSTPGHRYLASWSISSSHGRQQRTGSSRSSNHIEHIDSAIAVAQDGESPRYVNERSNQLLRDDGHEGSDHESHREMLKRGILEKWQTRIKNKLNQDAQTNTFLGRTRGRKRSLIALRHLEYPEWEHVRGDAMSVAQIEAHFHGQPDNESMQRQEVVLKADLSGEIKRQVSTSSSRLESKQETDGLTGKLLIAPDSIELENLTPTKGIAERTEARKSREKAGKKTKISTSLMIGRSQPQSRFKEDLKMSVHKCSSESAKEVLANFELESNAVEALKDHLHPCDANTHSIHGGYRKELDVDMRYSGFYEDCTVTPEQDDVCRAKKAPTKMSVFGMRSQGNRERSKDSGETRASLTTAMSFEHLRRSTDDFHLELQKMEKFEREKALRIVKEAWGSGS